MKSLKVQIKQMAFCVAIGESEYDLVTKCQLLIMIITDWKNYYGKKEFKRKEAIGPRINECLWNRNQSIHSMENVDRLAFKDTLT